MPRTRRRQWTTEAHKHRTHSVLAPHLAVAGGYAWRGNGSPARLPRSTTAQPESAHVRRTLLAAVGFGGDTSLLRCTFCASARDSMANFDRFPLFSASPEKHLFGKSGRWPKTAEIDQASDCQRVRTASFFIFYTSTRPSQHSRTVLLKIVSGQRAAEEPRS